MFFMERLLGEPSECVLTTAQRQKAGLPCLRAGVGDNKTRRKYTTAMSRSGITSERPSGLCGASPCMWPCKAVLSQAPVTLHPWGGFPSQENSRTQTQSINCTPEAKERL